MKKFWLLVAFLMATVVPASADVKGAVPFGQAVTTTLTQVIAAPKVGAIHITSYQASAYETATGGYMQLEYGTGTNCGTNTTVFSVPLTTGVTIAAGASVSGEDMILPVGVAFCVGMSGGTVGEAFISGTYKIY